MNDILQQIMNMIENTRTVPSISSFSMIGFTVLLIFGVINCILGYRLLRFWMMLCGFVIGAGIGFGAAYTGGVTEKYMYAVFMVGAGVLLAVIAFVSYKIGIFILGAGIGIGLGIYVFHPTTSLVFFFCLHTRYWYIQQIYNPQLFFLCKVLQVCTNQILYILVLLFLISSSQDYRPLMNKNH